MDNEERRFANRREGPAFNNRWKFAIAAMALVVLGNAIDIHKLRGNVHGISDQLMIMEEKQLELFRLEMGIENIDEIES